MDEQPNPVGRPTKYTLEHDDLAYKLALLGCTDKEIAEAFGVTDTTVNNWKLSHPTFLESLCNGKLIADAEVAKSLYERAKGYSHADVDIRVIDGQIVQTPLTKHYPPDERAARLWLTNRQGKRWRDKTETGITDKEGNDVLDPLEIARRAVFLLMQADKKP